MLAASGTKTVIELCNIRLDIQDGQVNVRFHGNAVDYIIRRSRTFKFKGRGGSSKEIAHI